MSKPVFANLSFLMFTLLCQVSCSALILHGISQKNMNNMKIQRERRQMNNEYEYEC
jgi:type III secretory pathway lipoprotein EscJ